MNEKGLTSLAARLSNTAIDRIAVERIAGDRIQSQAGAIPSRTGNTGNTLQQSLAEQGLKAFPVGPQNWEQTGNTTGNNNGDHLGPAHRRLREIINQIAALWSHFPPPAADRPWLEGELEQKLDQAINDRFHAGDAAGAVAAIEAWRSAWIQLLQTQPEDQRRDWLPVESEVLGGEVIVFVRDDQTAVPAAYVGAVRYTVAELERLQGLDPDALRAVHAAKKSLAGQVVGAMVEESDGRRPLARELFTFKDLPGLSDAEVLRRLNNPKTPIQEWQACSHAAAARGLFGHVAPAHAGGFRRHPLPFCSPENPAPGHRLWRSVHGVVVCGYCHPPAHPTLVAEWLPAQPEEIETESNINTAPAEPEVRRSASAAGDSQNHEQLARGPAGEQKGDL